MKNYIIGVLFGMATITLALQNQDIKVIAAASAWKEYTECINNFSKGHGYTLEDFTKCNNSAVTAFENTLNLKL